MALLPGAVATAISMLIIGRINNIVDPRVSIAFGMIVFGYSTWMLGGLNVQAGYWDVFWPQLVQGVGMSLLFVPLTTVSMDSIPRERIGNATSLFNLMRNIGGSVGIAVTGTLLARHTQATTSTLGSHVTMYDQASQSMFTQLRAGFMAAGADAVTATERAYGALFGMVQRQASMVAFVGLFQLLGLMFLGLLPLVLIMRKPKGGGHVGGAH